MPQRRLLSPQFMEWPADRAFDIIGLSSFDANLPRQVWVFAIGQDGQMVYKSWNGAWQPNAYD
jgi:hypothetical protein